ncbi:unnamed protein product [Sympodiomycopsis kandeliae]
MAESSRSTKRSDHNDHQDEGHHRKRSRREPKSDTHRKDEASDSDSDSDDDTDKEPRVHSRVIELGSQGLTPDDYYQKSTEYRHWLIHSGTASKLRKKLNLSRSKGPPEGGIYLDELTSKEAHELFENFVDRWNDGKLNDEYYTGKLVSSKENTGYKWKFSGKTSEKDKVELERIRDGVDSLTNSDSRGAREARDKERGKVRSRNLDEGQDGRRGAASSGSVGTGANTTARDSGWGNKRSDTVGPSFPTRHHSDSRFEEEEAREAQKRAAQATRRAERRDARDIEEERNPRATGRDAIREKRRERNQENRAFEAQSKGDGDVHLTENELMGEDNSFQAALAARSRASNKRSEVQQTKRDERESEMQTRRDDYRKKEDQTMQMLKDLAKNRFG